MNLESDEPLAHEDDRPRFSGYLVNLGPKATTHEKWVKAAQKAEAQAPQRRLTDAKWYRAHCDREYENWKADRDLVISRYEPRNDPEPLQRDLFK